MLLRSLAESGGLECGHYADTFEATFGPGSGFDGYRDVSTKVGSFMLSALQIAFVYCCWLQYAVHDQATTNCVPLPSSQGFLRNYARAMPPPLSGANDAQANAIARLAPLVAAFGLGMQSPGGGEDDEQPAGLLKCVELATRVTQNTVRYRRLAVTCKVPVPAFSIPFMFA